VSPHKILSKYKVYYHKLSVSDIWNLVVLVLCSCKIKLWRKIVQYLFKSYFATSLKEEESDNEENFIDLNALKAQTYRSVSGYPSVLS